MKDDPLRVTQIVRFPKNEGRPGSKPGFRITEFYAFTCIDDDDTEGLVAYFNGPQGWMPLVTADKTRMDYMRTLAQQVATATGKTIKISVFSVREDVEEIKPQT